MNFIDNNNILYAKQSVFRTGHSTSHAIISLVDKVGKALDNGRNCSMKKALDTVLHTILPDTFYKIGIRGKLFCLIQSYLETIPSQKKLNMVYLMDLSSGRFFKIIQKRFF